jgi:hypothetical protein
VFFRKSDVVVAGDIFNMNRFPVIGVEKGGSSRAPLASARGRRIVSYIRKMPYFGS